MIRPPVEANSGLAAVLRGVIADFQHASGADIVSIFLYEESTHTYYAPFATGQPQESLLDSLTDMHEQLTRYLSDERQGKVPDELGIHQYGSTVWLTVTRQRLVARNAPAEIDSTFIRRYQVQSTIGLPLLYGDRLLGLIYLNYRSKERAPDDNRLKELERRAGTAAGLIQAALEGAERSALDGLSRLTSLLTTPVGDARTNAKELRRLLSIALADLLMASNLDGAAIYQFGQQRSHLELVTAHLRVAAPTRVERGDASTAWENALQKTVGEATAEADLHPVATYALGQPDDPHGYLVLLSRDHLATVRRAPSTDEMLRAGAQLIGGALASQRLIAELENSNRLLSALGDMTAAMLKPGASRHQVIDAVAGHLTDSEVPEFDFNFATVYLLDERDDGATIVRMAAGAATGTSISTADTRASSHAGKRVPRWALDEDRLLAEDDVLVFVARGWQPVIVGPMPSTDHSDVLSGGIPVQSTWIEVPVVYSNGTVLGQVLACLIGEKERSHVQGPPFTLAGEVFERGGHKDLIRVFVPFGSDQSRRATGVLEVGYHRSDERRPDWGQVEALRAAAGQLAVAVETARLYEDAQRHAEQLELVADVSKAIASSIDLDQTLRLVAQNLARLVDASLCQIALYEEDRARAAGRHRRHLGQLAGRPYVHPRLRRQVADGAAADRRRADHRRRCARRAQPQPVVPARRGAEGAGAGGPGGGGDQERPPARPGRRRASPAEGFCAHRLWAVGPEGLPAPSDAQAVLQLPHPCRGARLTWRARPPGRQGRRGAHARRLLLLGQPRLARPRPAGA
ncbi:MAG: GAF domain-containing protein [Chloroflexi bacterium]|nr:MAG: GAF domain-containing protein [Chloroflexota bacterium]